jgi:succinate dehydrogenase flavin-adding protein (antitoxin of CptAB toxin-antitoxin module)
MVFIFFLSRFLKRRIPRHIYYRGVRGIREAGLLMDAYVDFEEIYLVSGEMAAEQNKA